ncbi:RagB/SusD family nutrient uptake outer membrane protein [Sunxiuqinia sp. A32]|uniref:RagB/SusD family nutrient uptake outer membrane protein n=1 Tax=Sunxiuqinia sp. A32 TaxID=3461496 RepID=UPI004045E765
MKTYIFSIILAFSLLVTTSCDSYLDQVNPNQLSADLLGDSESDLNLLLMGAYNTLQKPANFNRYFRFLDCLTDVAQFDRTGFINVTDGGSTTEMDFYRIYWTGLYMLVGRTNELISVIDGIESPSTQIKIIESEAKFLRSLAYYRLTALFKDVPLIIGKTPFEDRFVEKNTQAEIKEQILEDLDYAIENLPVSQDYPRATKGAALTLAAKVRAYFSDWDDVATLTKQVMDLGVYELYPDYEELFTVEAEGSNEAVFAVAFASDLGMGDSFSGSYPLQPFQFEIKPLPSYADAFYCTDGLPITQSPLYDEVNFYENRDPRYDVTVLRKGEIVANGQPFDPKRSVTKYCIQKYVRITTTDHNNDGPQDLMVFRYADVLLLRAEALIEKNTITPEVYQLIDQVRARVDMPKVEDVEGSSLSQSELREIIRHERLVEFGEEGIRWFDIKRWGIVEQVYNSITYRARPYLGEKTLYWPIPQREINNNPNLVQHDFWN